MTEKPNVKKYIEQQILGDNKFESALKAHYSENVARKPSIIERTQAYAIIINDILDKNAMMLQVTLDNVNFELHNEVKDWNKIKLMTEVAKNLTNVHSVLTPKVTVKEVQNKDGTTTRTMWGSNSSIAKSSEV